MANLNVDLLTPAGTIIRGIQADEVVVPLLSGEIGILPGHESLVGQLGTGVVVLRTGQDTNRFLVTHGICRVEQDRVTILSSTSEASDKIDLDRAQRALKLAQEKLIHTDQLTNDEIIKYQRKLERAQARIRMAYLRQ